MYFSFHFRTNTEKSLQNKKRVIKMLFVVVLEFFICWTPLYVINTITLFDPQIVYKTLGYTTITYFQLLAYTSSCCNPITYCFMNRGFRKACLNLFRCFRHFHETRRISIGGPIGVTQSSEVTQLHRIRTARETLNSIAVTQAQPISISISCDKNQTIYDAKWFKRCCQLNMQHDY